jgi:hypothetical protein
MNTIVWVIVIPVILVLFLFIAKVISGFRAPPEISGRRYLRKELIKNGIRKEITDECIDDFVEISILAARADKISKRDHFNNSFVSSLENMALIIKTGLNNPNDPLFKKIDGCKNTYRDIFEQHGLF